DLVFSDVTDRDADFYKDVEGNPNTWWGPADFARHDRYIAGFTRRTHTPVLLWQLPVGDTDENDTWKHFRDDRLEWWLAPGSAAPGVPRRGVRITASPVAPSAGVNGGASDRANCSRPAGGRPPPPGAYKITTSPTCSADRS